MRRLRLRWRLITGSIQILIEPADLRHRLAGMNYCASIKDVPVHFFGSTEAAAIGNLLVELGEAFGFKIQRTSR